MSANIEEQEMEAEALGAIFASSFEARHGEQPFVWAVRLLPIEGDADDLKEDDQNHVGITLVVKIPVMYPEVLPEFDIEIIKGLSEEHKAKLLKLAEDEAANNEGMPAIFAVCEVLREWLIENNRKGLDDISMHAQMLRREQEKKQQEMKNNRDFESQQAQDSLTEAELEEQAVRKQREEGTPCTKETFDEWKKSFDAEMASVASSITKVEIGQRQKEKIDDKTGRVTGFDHFQSKGVNLIEIEEMDEDGNPPSQIDTEEIDENLFNLEEDEELDDLDFDDDDDDDDNEEENGGESEPDI